MAKTIKEMAAEAYPDAVNYNTHCRNLDKRHGYILGAKTVLYEIISCWDWENKDNRLLVPAELVLHKIEDKIKELKGEL